MKGLIKLALVVCLFFGAWQGLNTFAPASMWSDGFKVAGHLVSYGMLALGTVIVLGWKRIK